MTDQSSSAQLPRFRLDQMASDEALQSFQKNGCLQIDGFLPPEVIETLQAETEQCFESRARAGAVLKVGDKRRMITLPVQGVFDDARLYAPPALLACFETLLGPNPVINVFGCVVSKPGAKDQHTHTDYHGLFGSPLDYLAPSYAINLFVPLIALDALSGSTQMWPGTHKKPHAVPEDHVGIIPHVPLGSAMLMDYRVQHRGTANRSAHMRPILTIAYSRCWFMDMANFAKLAPLDLSQERYESMDSAHKSLFKHAKLYFENPN